MLTTFFSQNQKIYLSLTVIELPDKFTRISSIQMLFSQSSLGITKSVTSSLKIFFVLVNEKVNQVIRL